MIRSERVMATAEGMVLTASSNELLTYQLSTVVSWTTVAFTGNGESGFDTGEGA